MLIVYAFTCIGVIYTWFSSNRSSSSILTSFCFRHDFPERDTMAIRLFSFSQQTHTRSGECELVGVAEKDAAHGIGAEDLYRRKRGRHA